MRTLSKCSKHSQAGHLQGLSVTQSWGRHVFLPWPFDREERTRVATGPAFNMLFWHSRVGLKLLSKTSMSGRMGVLWKRNRTWPVLSRVYSRAAIISHLLKIAPTFHQQRQSRQDMARAFIFKYSLLPSKSNNRLGNILLEAVQLKSMRRKLFWVFLRFLPLYAPLN